MANMGETKLERQILTRLSAAHYEAFVRAVAQEIQRFNVQFRETERRLHPLERCGASGFQVRRANSDSYTLIVQFNIEGPEMRYDIQSNERHKVTVCMASGFYGFSLQCTGDVVLTKGKLPITIEEASRRLILQAI